jgi:glycosyltransferase involved in cell wall biosynthesis
MPSTSLSVVVPVFDERDNLRAVDGELREVLATLPLPTEIVYVDDGSVDGSREVLRQLVEENRGGTPRVRVLELRRNYGQTAALAAGFAAASGEIVVAMDGDGQNDPHDIPRLLAKLEQGHDVVSGWRRHRRDNALSRRLPSVVANWFLSRISGLRLHDFGCTLKAYRASVLRQVHLYGEMHRFLPAHLHRVGARVVELDVAHRPRRQGRSKYGASRVFRVLLDLVLIRFMSRYLTRPMHFFGKVGLWMFTAGAGIGGLAVAFKLGWLRAFGIDYRADFVQTPLPALVVSLWVGAVIAVFFGILAEILIRVLYESQGLATYTVAGELDSSLAGGRAAAPRELVRTAAE